MKISCEIIRDLLPLYMDGVCSEESRKAVDEHVRDCEKCREELRLMGAEIQSTHPQEEEPVKAAAAAWKRGKHKAFLKGSMITLIIVALVAGILAHCLVPVTISVKEFKTEDIFQHRIIKWGLSETAVRLLWGKQVEIDPVGAPSAEYEQMLWSRDSCVINDERGDMAFYFKDGRLYIMEMMFRNIKDNTWGEQMLEELREYYGTETRAIEKNGKVISYNWDLGDSRLMYIPGYSTASIYLFEKIQ